MFRLCNNVPLAAEKIGNSLAENALPTPILSYFGSIITIEKFSLKTMSDVTSYYTTCNTIFCTKLITSDQFYLK